MKYAIIISILAVLAFAQTQVMDAGGGKAEGKTAVLRSSIAQPLAGTRENEVIRLESGYLLVCKGGSRTAPTMNENVGDACMRPAKITSISPNPFNSACAIEFEIGEENDVLLEILDVAGRIVDTPIGGERLEPGQYSLTWNGDDLASGTYFARLTVGEQVISRKMVYVR